MRELFTWSKNNADVNIIDILEQSGVLLGPNDVGYYKVLVKLTVTSQYVRHLTVKKVLFTVNWLL